MTSMMPDRKRRVMPVAAVASLKAGSSDHRSEPVTLKRGSSVRGRCAPFDRSGRCALTAADLGAFERGPVDWNRRRGAGYVPARSSALVPTSTRSVISGRRGSGPPRCSEVASAMRASASDAPTVASRRSR